MNMPVMMAQEYWANSQFSVAKYYGGAKINGEGYTIVNKDGVTLMELSNPDSKHYVKEGQAIPPGEPADLVLNKWVPIYKRLGRDNIIRLVEDGVSYDEAKKMNKSQCNERYKK